MDRGGPLHARQIQAAPEAAIATAVRKQAEHARRAIAINGGCAAGPSQRQAGGMRRQRRGRRRRCGGRRGGRGGAGHLVARRDPECERREAVSDGEGDDDEHPALGDGRGRARRVLPIGSHASRTGYGTSHLVRAPACAKEGRPRARTRRAVDGINSAGELMIRDPAGLSYTMLVDELRRFWSGWILGQM